MNVRKILRAFEGGDGRRFSVRSVCGKLKKIEDTHSNLSRREEGLDVRF